MTARAVRRLVVDLCTRAGLDAPATPHVLHHTFASQVVGRNGNVRVARALFRHRRLSSPQIDTHPGPAELEAAAGEAWVPGRAPRLE